MHFLRPSLIAFVGGLGIGAVGIASASLVGCSSSSGESNGNGSSSSSESSASTSGSTSSSSQVTFTQVYGDVLGMQCGPVCHYPGGPGVVTGKLDMSTQAVAYQNLVGDGGGVEAMGAPDGCAGDGIRVVPGKPDASVLAEKVDPKLFPSLGCGQMMPLGGSLPQSQIVEIESWIMAGALNN
jgi:hypothetical protein